MKHILLLCLIIITTCSVALAAPPVKEFNHYDITTITPGKEYSLMILAESAPGVPADNWGRFFIATINATDSLHSKLYARFYVELAVTSPGGFRLKLTPEQTRALAGKSCRWQLLLVPDLGEAIRIAYGSLEVKKQ